MNKYNLEHVQKTITLGAGTDQKQIGFNIPGGKLVGFATKQVGDLPAGATADIAITDGANDVLRALDVDFSEITTKGSTEEIITGLVIKSADDISVTISTTKEIAEGKEFSVKVVLFYAAQAIAADQVTLSNCRN